ncbi:hypothetical protein K1T71_009283 [Dendrolimus kikuchii]|uniref:Uncharacterized protein n=1 Tax=Dendrolimus kikuchii TaxID=765133 RepID=A0ACC1CU82_9NEOP|nr:hypothetical protein K1T71_009283 [Dendrolimus kikuchii]
MDTLQQSIAQLSSKFIERMDTFEGDLRKGSSCSPNITTLSADFASFKTFPDSGEHLFIDVSLHHTKILLGVYYSPSLRNNFFSSFESMLETLVPQYPHTIIMGDFNTCLLKCDTRSSSFQTLVNSINLNILPLNATHHFPNTTASLLDLILVSSPTHVIKHGQCSADMFSYHDMIYLSYNVRPPKAKSKLIVQRNFGGMNTEDLRKDAQGLDWSGVANAVSIDDKVNAFNTTLLGLYDLHAPLRQIKLKHHPAPWLTDEIKCLINQKSKAKTRFKCRPTDVNRQAFINARNRCNRACRNAQRRYIHSSVENDNPAKVWKFLKSLGVGKSSHVSNSNNLNINLLNQHFATSSDFSPTIKSKTLKVICSLPTPQHSPFVLSQFTDCDVVRAVKSITSNAVGSDIISRNMILPILDVISPIISHILNYSIATTTFPLAWREAEIIPLPKKRNPLSFSDFRPISILSFMSKVLERLVHQQLSAFLNKNCLMNPYQSGFRPGHSTTTALIKITDDIRQGMDNGLLTVLSLLDFSSAFNNVDFEILLAILRSLNISPTVIDWFRSYLYGRQQRIRIDESYSSWQSLTAGVPQGGVLSPLLFAIFINTISYNLSSSYHLYADDLQIYAQARVENIKDAINTINDDLGRILAWSRAHGLKVNPSKTQAIIIGSSRMISKINWSLLPDLLFDGTCLHISDKVKNLGVIIDRELSWWPHITELSRRVFASSASLRRLKYFLPTATKVTIDRCRSLTMRTPVILTLP